MAPISNMKHNIPMETTTVGTIFEVYLMITLLQSIATNLVIYFQGIYLFQTATRPFTDQGVGSGIVLILYLNVYLNVVI